MTKKQRKTVDPYVGVLLVVPKSVAARWRAAAESEGLTIHEWARQNLPEG